MSCFVLQTAIKFALGQACNFLGVGAVVCKLAVGTLTNKIMNVLLQYLVRKKHVTPLHNNSSKKSQKHVTVEIFNLYIFFLHGPCYNKVPLQ